MNDEDYPALFLSADKASNDYQWFFLLLVKSEYALLFGAACLSLEFLKGVEFYILYSGIFFLGLAILLTRSLKKPEQDWYRCRALAESVKTLTWRYMMHAAPFNKPEQESRAEFRNQLHLVVDDNRSTAQKITNDRSGKDQITAKAENIRAQKRADRLDFYVANRIDQQRNWYSKKSQHNKTAARNWVIGSATSYLLAGFLTLARIAYPNWSYWPIEPLIVIAASIIGWMQIKKYNELSAAYTVAAHEIGLVKIRSAEINRDEAFSEFVNDAEKAFSREHTLWLARQSD